MAASTTLGGASTSGIGLGRVGLPTSRLSDRRARLGNIFQDPSGSGKRRGRMLNSPVGPGSALGLASASGLGSASPLLQLWRSADDYQARRNNPIASRYLQQAVALARFELGMYEVIETYTPADV